MCHSFRYTFPLRTSGAIVLGGETFIDCAFETKYKVKVQNCESNFFIGRLNLIKGTFIAINFPYRMEKFTSFSTFLVSEKFQLSHHIQERERLEKKNFDFLSFSKSFRVARKNSFSLCWSTSRISSAISGFFFNPFVESRYKLYYFNRRIFKKYILNPSFQLSFKKKILRRLNFHIFRASHVPLVFPFNLFQKTAKIVSQGLKLIFFSLGYFLKRCFYFSADLFIWHKNRPSNLEFDFLILILQKKGKENGETMLPFSSRFFLSYRVKEQLNNLPKRLIRNYFESVKENKFENFFFLKKEEITWNNELSLSEMKLNFFSRRRKEKFFELFSFTWSSLANSLNCYLSKNKRNLYPERAKKFLSKNKIRSFFSKKESCISSS